MDPNALSARIEARTMTVAVEYPMSNGRTASVVYLYDVGAVALPTEDHPVEPRSRVEGVTPHYSMYIMDTRRGPDDSRVPGPRHTSQI